MVEQADFMIQGSVPQKPTAAYTQIANGGGVTWVISVILY